MANQRSDFGEGSESCLSTGYLRRYLCGMDLAAFQKELHDLLKKHEVSIGADVQGDTHGVRCNFVVVEKSGKEHVLVHYESMVDAHELARSVSGEG